MKSNSYSRLLFCFFLSLTAEDAAMAQNKMGDINNNSGIVTQGQKGDNTLITGNQRLRYSDALASKLAAQMPDKNKAVYLTSIGSNADYAVATQFQAYLQHLGFNVTRSHGGQVAPAPDHKLSFEDTPQAYLIEIAPSAIE